MKKIYFAHSSGFDFKKDLYLPIRCSKLNSQYNFIFPHEHGLGAYSSKEFFKTCDFVFAEVSFASTGTGIELGWANYQNVPIIGFYKVGNKVASSTTLITNKLIEYKDKYDLVDKMQTFLNNIN